MVGEGNPEGEPIPSLDLGVVAWGEHVVLVVGLRCRRQKRHHHRHRNPHNAVDLFHAREIELIADLWFEGESDAGFALPLPIREVVDINRFPLPSWASPLTPYMADDYAIYGLM